MTHLVHVADRLLNRPLLVHPQRAEVMAFVLHERLGVAGDAFQPGPEASAFMGSRVRADGSARLSKADRGVAFIRVTDTLVNRGSWLNSSSGLTAYEGIAAQVRDAADDRDVHSIILDIDSPGGEATGMFALAGLIRTVRQSKRVVAMVDDMAASAAYGIASAADEIVISPTSIVGSIGVVLLHLDRSGELAAKGIKPTLIHAGAHKIDGNSFGPLTEKVTADLQAEVNAFYAQFLATVSEGRGMRMAAEQARATEARVFVGADALKLGLADRIATLDEVLTGLRAKSGPVRANGGLSMSKQNEDQAGAISQETHAAAVNAARADGEAAGEKKGAAAAYSRIGAILADGRVKGRERAAMTLASKSPDMSAEDVYAFVAENGAPAATSLDQRLGADANGGPLPEGQKNQNKDDAPDFLARMKSRHGL